VSCITFAALTTSLSAQTTTPADQGRDTLNKAVVFLKSKQQPDGSWQTDPRIPPAVTAMSMRVLAQDPATGPKSEEVQRALKWVLAVQKEDGGFYRDMLASYNTAIIVSALASLNDPALKPAIDKGVAYLKANQFTDKLAGANGQGIDPNSPQFGGWNYGGGRGGPDLSNTAVVLDALRDSGMDPNDPAFQNALKFVTKLQNFSETNSAAWAGDDGGFIYNPGRNGEGNSAAGEYTTADGKKRQRSYGAMTYAGLKSMIYAGVNKDDPRVKAAWSWISGNWTVDENPGMAANNPDAAKAGLFYYYHTLAKALGAYGEANVTDSKGVKHDWRSELIGKLAAIQQPDGSFIGTRQWMESDPIIATTLGTLALQDALSSQK
jgi:squalene-hopene/tetraprenyl-beta-curcumene cyclase